MSESSVKRILTPMRRVRGLGAAGSGTGHFWHQRVTSVALLSLTAIFIVIVVMLLGRSHAAATQILGQPLVAILMMLFIGTGVYHMWIGMQEIIIDYVHDDLPRLLLLMSNTFFCFFMGVGCIFAVLKMSFGV
jgi:succinate dehydrogenase / fumarate reductase, membrane anchor subunit